MSNSICIDTQDVDTQYINASGIEILLKAIIQQENAELGNISVIFLTDEKLLSVNQEFLGHNTLTDIITFDYCEDYGNVSGDLFISYDRVKENAFVFNTAIHQEIYRVVAHGVLHLLGYNDHSDEEIQVMRQKEDFYIKLICSDVRKI